MDEDELAAGEFEDEDDEDDEELSEDRDDEEESEDEVCHLGSAPNHKLTLSCQDDTSKPKQEAQECKQS